MVRRLFLLLIRTPFIRQDKRVFMCERLAGKDPGGTRHIFFSSAATAEEKNMEI
jgi:hypothetical protein